MTNTTPTPSGDNTNSDTITMTKQMYEDLVNNIEQLTIQHISQNKEDNFGLYMQQQNVKNIDMHKYDVKQSLRTYFREFEEQASYNGITNYNVIAPVLSRFLPDNMRKWIIHLPGAVRNNWKALTDNLLQYYGKNIQVEQREAIDYLKKLHQKRSDTIALHTTQWMNAMHDIPNVEAAMSNVERRDTYVQSLYDPGLVATLSATIIMNTERGTPVSLDYITKVAIKIGHHKNYECDQHNNSIHQIEITDDEDEGLVEIQHIEAGYINHINQNNGSITPITIIKLAGKVIYALWDTGAAISAIDKDTCEQLKLKIDKSTTMQYIDINNNCADTEGVTYMQLFNTKVKLHVIKNLAKQLVIGIDTMKKWKTSINTENNKIVIKTKQQTYHLQYNTQQPQAISHTDTQSQQLNNVLKSFQPMFLSGDQKPSITNKMECSIDTGNHEPIYTPPRHYHPQIQQQIDKKFEELEKNGIVTQVPFLEWGSPVTAVLKPDKSIRICGNYICLNKITKSIKYPFVNLHHALQSLGKARVFSKIDLIAGYYQIPICEKDRIKSALVTTTTIYVFNSMGMGMKNSSAYFQSLMDKVLGPMRYNSAIAYQDDMILYSDNFEQHLQHLQQLLERFQEANQSVNWKEEQQKDTDLLEYKDKSFTDSNNILYKILQRPQNNMNNKLCKVVPKQLIQEVIQEFHDKQFAGHAGISKKYTAISRQFRWINMKDDISKYINKCNKCQSIKGNRSHQHTTSNTAGDAPFARIAMDFFGPLPKSESANTYILVIMDTFTKYVEIIPTTSITASELAPKFYCKYILRHGLPREIISDNGAPFNSEFIKELNKYLQIDMIFTPPYHASSNRIVERYMQTMRQMILIYAHDNQIYQQWDKNLRLIRFVYNNMIHQSTGYSPFELVHGRQPSHLQHTIQTSEELPLYRGQAHTPQSLFANQIKTNLNKAFELVYDKLTENEHYDYNNVLEVGQKVMLFNIAKTSRKEKPRKLQHDWIGPMKVTKRLSTTRYNLQHNKKEIKNIYISYIKKYYD